MSAHQKRNSKTALMVSISLAFIIMGGSGAQLETQLLTDYLASKIGSDLVAWSLPMEETGLDEYQMRMFLDKVMVDNPDYIKNYTFISRGTSLGYPYNKIRISPLC